MTTLPDQSPRLPSDHVDAWFDRALDLDRQGRTDEALDVVYDRINTWLREPHFGGCDAFLGRLNVESLPTRMLLAIAINTRPVSDELLNRQEFFERAWKSLESRGNDARKLLGRLRYAPHLAASKRPSRIKRFQAAALKALRG